MLTYLIDLEHAVPRWRRDEKATLDYWQQLGNNIDVTDKIERPFRWPAPLLLSERHGSRPNLRNYQKLCSFAGSEPVFGVREAREK